jgi:hypothetical protein
LVKDPEILEQILNNSYTGPTYEDYLKDTKNTEKNNAINTAVDLAKTNTVGLHGLKERSAYIAAKDQYEKLGGSRDEFDAKVKE